MALGKKRRSKKKFVAPKLMLTSMMDMFTIILIFLIFSFSENPETMTLGDDLELPRSNTEAEYSDAIKIILSKKDLRVNDEILAEVQDQQIVGLVPDDLKASVLYQKLKITRDAYVPPEDDPEKMPHVLFMCDRSYSFKTINQVIKTAGMAGYPNFQFAVLEEK